MQSNTIRNMWLDTLWKRLHESFDFKTLPEEALVVCGHPSRQARGSADRRRPAEITVGEWRGNPEEKAFVSVHPERFSTEKEVALAILWGAAGAMFGPQGARRFGLHKSGHKLTVLNSEAGRFTSGKLKTILDELGNLPSGVGRFPDESHQTKQTTRLRKWVCPSHPDFIVRIASDTKGVDLVHSPQASQCGERLIIVETTPTKKEN